MRSSNLWIVFVFAWWGVSVLAASYWRHEAQSARAELAQALDQFDRSDALLEKCLTRNEIRIRALEEMIGK